MRCLLAVLTLASLTASDATPIRIGLDAEFGHTTSTSAQSIQLGATLAIEEINAAGGVLGRPLHLITKDNRSIPARGEADLRELAADPTVVAVLGGKFSTCVLPCVPVAQELGIPLLATWSSADGIIDHEGKPSWTFRLSLRDTWVAPALLERIRADGHQRTGLLLPANGWGRSNQQVAERTMREKGMECSGLEWYPFGATSLNEPYQRLLKSGATALLLVANEGEGATLIREIGSLPREQRIPVYAHWGITGGKFPTLVGSLLSAVDLRVVQSFSFSDPAPNPVRDRVVAALAKRLPGVSPPTIDSPVGLAHAYDLVHLVAAAIRRSGSADRGSVREALEHLPPYDGLVRRYEHPFTPERHEALDAGAVMLCRWNDRGELKPLGLP